MNARAGASAACVVAGAVLLGLPAAGAPAAGVLPLAPLTVGALAMVLVVVRPRVGSAGALAGLVVLCAALVLVARPVDPVIAGECGLAALGFLLAVQLRRRIGDGSMELGAWLTAYRPVLLAAALTTAVALAAATVPDWWAP